MLATTTVVLASDQWEVEILAEQGVDYRPAAPFCKHESPVGCRERGPVAGDDSLGEQGWCQGSVQLVHLKYRSYAMRRIHVVPDQCQQAVR